MSLQYVAPDRAPRFLGVVRSWSALGSLISVGAIYLLAGSLIAPLNVLFENEETWTFGTIGGAPVTIYELASIPVSLALLGVGTRIRHHVLALSGLIGLGLFLVRGTERHFADVLSWPLGLALGGAAAMALGAWLTFARSSRRG